MDQSRQNTTVIAQEHEISLKDLIIKFSEWIKYLLHKWLPICLFGIVGAGAGLLYAVRKQVFYVAELTFVMEEGKSGQGMGAYSGLASQLGLDMGSNNTSGVFAGDNIMGFLKSRLMIEKTLLSPITYNGKKVSMADSYLSFNKISEAWKNDPVLKNVHFPLDIPRSRFTLLQDSVLSIIYQDVNNNYITVDKPDKKLSFIAVRCKSTSEIFSKQFTEYLVNEATQFYIETKTKRSKANVDKLQHKADSLERQLNQKTYSVAAAQDVNLNPAKRVALVSAELNNRDKMALQTMYTEVMKNLEVSKMAMSEDAPLIQIVDTPILPLKKEKFRKLKGLMIGGFMAAFLTIIYFIIRKFFRETMNI
jgi:hypothetical protein